MKKYSVKKVVISLTLGTLFIIVAILGELSFAQLILGILYLLGMFGLIKFALMFSKPFIEGFKQAEEKERREFIQELAEEIKKSSDPCK